MKPYHTPNMGSFKAGADLSAKQFHWVKAGTVAGTVVAVAAVTDKPLGILMNAPVSGEAADVALPGGGAKLKLHSSAGTVTTGCFVRPHTDGKGIKAINLEDHMCAQVDSIGSSAANSDIVPVLVMHAAHVPGFVSVTVGATMAVSPESTAEGAFLTVSSGGVEYDIPMYAHA